MWTFQNWTCWIIWITEKSKRLIELANIDEFTFRWNILLANYTKGQTNILITWKVALWVIIWKVDAVCTTISKLILVGIILSIQQDLTSIMTKYGTIIINIFDNKHVTKGRRFRPETSCSGWNISSFKTVTECNWSLMAFFQTNWKFHFVLFWTWTVFCIQTVSEFKPISGARISG